jgi:hypothetical protein
MPPTSPRLGRRWGRGLGGRAPSTTTTSARRAAVSRDSCRRDAPGDARAGRLSPPEARPWCGGLTLRLARRPPRHALTVKVFADHRSDSRGNRPTHVNPWPCTGSSLAADPRRSGVGLVPRWAVGRRCLRSLSPARRAGQRRIVPLISGMVRRWSTRGQRPIQPVPRLGDHRGYQADGLTPSPFQHCRYSVFGRTGRTPPQCSAGVADEHVEIDPC